MASAVWKVNNNRPRKANRAVFERPQKPAYHAGNLHVPGGLHPPILLTPAIEGEDEDANDGLGASRSTPNFAFSGLATPARRKKTAVAAASESSTALVPPSPTLTLEPPSPPSTSDLVRQSASVVSLGDEIPTSPVMGKNWKQMQVSWSPSLLFLPRT